MRVMGNIILALGVAVFYDSYIKDRMRLCRHAVAAVFLGLALSACASPSPVDRQCGVIIDSLKDVRGATPEHDRRISVHYERGGPRGARCWQ